MSATAAKKQKPLKRHPSKLKKMSAYTILAIILISIMAVLFAFPLYWIITGSFKTGAAINSTTPVWWPDKWVPTTLYILVITTINSFQCFALIQLLTSGGPNHKTDTIMYYIYYTAFKQYKYGYGNAMGVVLAVIIAILSAVQFKLGNKDN